MNLNARQLQTVILALRVAERQYLDDAKAMALNNHSRLAQQFHAQAEEARDLHEYLEEGAF